MKTAVLGTGIVGRTIAGKLNTLGHEVFMGTRNPTSTLSNKEEDVYGNPPFSIWKNDHPDITLASFEEAAHQSEELIFNCTSGQASIAALTAAGAANLKGKVLIDVANPLDFSQGMPPFLNPVNTSSLAEEIQHEFPELKVIKSLNTMNAHIMINPSTLKGEHNVFVSGNDMDAKTTAKEVLISFGWTAENIIDLGDITTARGTEMLLPVWLRLWTALGTAEFNFHIQT